jgi:DNA-binding NtrC family response regulator
MERIVIVEDELIVARDIRKTLERNGYKVAGVATTVEKALTLVEETKPWLVLVDIFLKGSLTGIDLATALNKQGVAFIYVSANSNQPVLEAAKTTNPYGFIVKPFREKDLLVTIDIAKYRYENNKKLNEDFKSTNQSEENLIGKERTSESQIFQKIASSNCEGIIGKSAAMMHVFKLIQQVAATDTSVLLLGESGTGKEGVANCIVQQSKRSNKPFIKTNCAAIPAALMESEFFGHEKGAFTGAVDRKAGKFELASGGTILLDEIGEMPMDMQVKLLRVLQEKEIQRVGSSVTIKIDVRIIAATSRNLEKEIADGKFRLDLYYRLYVFPILLPALRDRKDDIPLLASHFIYKLSKQAGKGITNIATHALQEMMHYDWPGNVRELENMIERSVLLTEGKIITEIHLQHHEKEQVDIPTESSSIKSLEQNERDYILAVLKKSNGRVRGSGGAAELLGVPPTTLHSKMKKLGIKKGHE